MNRRIFPLILALLLITAPLFATDSPSFRGADGSGVFAAESGLLQVWPEGGPKRLWKIEGLGESYASVTVANGHIYTTGMKDQRGSVFAMTRDGKMAWTQEYGEEHNGAGYPGTRSTPTVDGETLYILSAMGKAVALNAADGSVRWERDLLADFKGENIYFGVSESPLIIGDKVIYSPGGADASVVALDKTSGETVWTSKGLSEISAYCTPRLFDNGKHRQIITFIKTSLVGLDPDKGSVLWTQELPAKYDIHATSPVFDGNSIYVSHGYDQGGKLFELAADGRSVAETWSEDKLDVHHGGAVFVDGRIYGAASKGTWYALDGKTGEIQAEIKRLGKGAVIYADGRLYGYTEKGEVVLVNPDPAKFERAGSFKIEEGEGNHWSHPVISNGLLYIRHGDVLMAYDIKG